MAVTAFLQKVNLSFSVQTGTTDAGNPIYSARTVSGILPSATDADLHALAEGLASLQKHPLNSVSKVVTSELISD